MCIITSNPTPQSLLNMNTQSQPTLTNEALNIHMADGGAGAIARDMVKAEGFVEDEDDLSVGSEELRSRSDSGNGVELITPPDSMRSDSGNESMCSDCETCGSDEEHCLLQLEEWTASLRQWVRAEAKSEDVNGELEKHIIKLMKEKEMLQKQQTFATAKDC